MPASSAWREPHAPPPARMIEIRCKACRRLLCKLDAEKGGRVELVCPEKHCRRYQVHALRPGAR